MKRIVFSLAFVLQCIYLSAQFKYYEQGINAYQAKDYAASIKNLNAYLDYVIRDKSFDVEVRYYLGLAYFKTESFTSAVREFDEALQLGHKNAGNIHWFMAKSYAALKVPKESIEEYNKALSLINEKSNQAKILFERSQQYLKLSETDQAKNDLTQALSFDNSNNEIKKTLASLSHSPNNQDTRTINNNKAGDGDQQVQNRPAELKKTSGKTDSTVLAKVEKLKNSEITPVVEIKNTEPSLADLYKDEKRYALVIGNSAYANVAPLRNAANDASDMADELMKSNFEVIRVINGNYNEMREAYQHFWEKLNNGPKDQTIGLFYYAGHGLQNEGENYLVPVEANIRYEDDIPRTCFALQRIVVSNMERSNSRMNIVILDACRNNPFASAFRSSTAGLTDIKRAKGSFIAFATAPGSIASDGEGRNGLYTQELLKAMRKPGKTIEQVFKDVRVNVMKLSDEKQFTWDQSNIIGDFYFKFK